MIEVTDLVKRHGEIEVLRGVSLSVARGEVAVVRPVAPAVPMCTPGSSPTALN